MIYVFNPTIAPQHVGKIVLPPKNYAVVTQDLARIIRECKIPVFLEGDPEFEDLWVRHKGAESAK